MPQIAIEITVKAIIETITIIAGAITATAGAVTSVLVLKEKIEEIRKEASEKEDNMSK